jgi:sensor histidine kinase regulating citrate/malate metabolism
MGLSTVKEEDEERRKEDEEGKKKTRKGNTADRESQAAGPLIIVDSSPVRTVDEVIGKVAARRQRASAINLH